MIALTSSVSFPPFSKAFVILIVVFISIFGAGAVDVLFPDVIPLHPYSGVYVVGSIQTIASELTYNVSIPFLFVIVVLALFLLSIVFHLPIFGITFANKAALHPKARHSADRHKQYVSLRNFSHDNQINVPLEKYVEEKRKTFEKKSLQKKEKIVGDEILWQDQRYIYILVWGPYRPMGRCTFPHCENEAVPCIMKWTDTDGNIIIQLCLKHEEEVHPK